MQFQGYQRPEADGAPAASHHRIRGPSDRAGAAIDQIKRAIILSTDNLSRITYWIRTGYGLLPLSDDGSAGVVRPRDMEEIGSAARGEGAGGREG